MASPSDQFNVPYIMKRLYGDKEPQSLAARKRVWLTKVPKRGDFTGQSLTIPVKYANPQSIYTTFAGAQGNYGQTKGIAWVGTRVVRYGDAQIDGVSILASGNKAGAFVELLEQEVNGTLDEHGRRLSNDCYGDGSGALAQIASVSAGVITLTNLDDAKNFAVSQSFMVNPTKTGSAGTLRVGAGVVSVLNEDAGQVTYTGTITGIAAGDWLYNGTSSANVDYDFGFRGLAAWLPTVAPTTGDNLMGVDRSVDPNRLAGWRLSRPGYSIEENAFYLGVRIQRAGGSPDIGLISPTNFAQLSLSLGTKVEYEGSGGSAGVGFSKVTLNLPSGPCSFYSDPDCQSDRFYLLQSDTFQVRYLGNGWPHIIMDDGNKSLRVYNADAIELRTRSIAQMFCMAPGFSGVCTIP